MKWLEEVNKEPHTSDQILSFDEYMQLFSKNPRRECRTSCIYLKDMFDHFEKNEKTAKLSPQNVLELWNTFPGVVFYARFDGDIGLPQK